MAKKDTDAAVAAIRRALSEWLLAATIFFEARGEPTEGQYAVAHVVMNRVKADRPRLFGSTIGEVCIKPHQFSCFNILRFADAFRMLYAEPKAFHDAFNIAAAVMAGKVPDNTGGATHYFADTIEPPVWADPKKRTVQIGHHIFYKLY